MKWFLCLMATITVLSSCDKTEQQQYDLSGLYVGYFHRTGMDTSLVSLRFTTDGFEGSSNMTNYPAICGGSYQLQENRIRFTDTCMWTANFDWSLILSGEYNVEITEATMRIWRTAGNLMDEYILRRPIR